MKHPRLIGFFVGATFLFNACNPQKSVNIEKVIEFEAFKSEDNISFYTNKSEFFSSINFEQDTVKYSLIQEGIEYRLRLLKNSFLDGEIATSSGAHTLFLEGEKLYKINNDLHLIYKLSYKTATIDGGKYIFFEPKNGVLIIKSLSWISWLERTDLPSQHVIKIIKNDLEFYEIEIPTPLVPFLKEGGITE